MQLSKTAYYADFAIYAIVLLVLISIAGLSADWAERLKWVAAFTTGGATWTFLEYLLHRFVLHRLPILTAMHAVHHASPRAFVGTPTWLTLAILWLVFFLPTWWGFSFNVASGLIAGVMMGFLWYGILHHAIHHGRPRALAALVSTCAHRHQQHHFSGQPGNFGVTIPLWDYLFGTVIHGRRVDQPGGGQKKAPIRTPAADN
jgi:sterol desaturase/sphingolipid hydroxylase (fatty acid hydroxylase superfamily)